LWFHAYWNAFSNADSTFSRGERQGGSSRSGTGGYDREDWGWTELRSARLPDGTDVRPTLRWEHPDDDNALDRTVFTLTLPAPVPPHGTLTLDLAWEARVPKVVARTGVYKKYTLFGQWFPKIGVLDVPPQRGVRAPTWSCHQFHATTEFYADFGSYDASLTVPRTMAVGATGVRTGRTENPDRTLTPPLPSRRSRRLRLDRLGGRVRGVGHVQSRRAPGGRAHRPRPGGRARLGTSHPGRGEGDARARRTPLAALPLSAPHPGGSADRG